MADIQYLNYGDLQIELLALMTKLADEVQGYVTKQPWSSKRKEKFMSAYLDIMNRGVLGASNSKGYWEIDVKGKPFPFDTMGRKDREMYEEAAYFIQLQMASLPVKTSENVGESEETKKTKTLFDSKYFDDSFSQLVNKDISGGKRLIIGGPDDLWNYFDERDEYGIRGRKKRANILAGLLEKYSKSLKEEDYDFENGPYGTLLNFRNKINEAITALKTDDITDDAPKLNAIGLNPNLWFYDGSGDPSGMYDKETGKELTYGLLLQLLKTQKLEEEKLHYKELLDNSGVLSISHSNRPIDAIYNVLNYNNWLAKTYGSGEEGFNKINQRVQELLEKSYNQGNANGLNQAERKELGNLIHYIRTNNPKYLNYNLTVDDENELSIHKNIKGKRLSDFVRLPWLTSDGRYIYADKSGNIYFLKPQNKKQILENLNFNLDKYRAYRNNFLKTPQLLLALQLVKDMNTPISQMDGLSPEMKRELEALAWDLGAFIDLEAVTGTAMALNAARLREKNRPAGFSWGKALDWGTAALGGLPILGDLLSVGKPLYRLGLLIKGSSLFLGYLATAFGALGIVGAKDSLYKLATSPTSLTPQDVLNIAYGLMGLAGIKTVRAGRAGNAYLEAKKGSLTPEHTIEIQTKNGEKKSIKVTKEEANLVKETYSKAKSNKEANDNVLSMESIRTKAKDQGIDLEGAKISTESSFTKGNVVSRRVFGTSPNPIRTRMVYDSKNPIEFDTRWRKHIFGGMNPWRAKVLDNVKVPEPSDKSLFRRINDYVFGDYTPKPNKNVENPKPNNPEPSKNTKEKGIRKSRSEAKKLWIDTFYKGKRGKEKLLSGDYNFTNKVNPDFNFNIHVDKSGKASLKLGAKDIQEIKFKSQEELLDKIILFLEQIHFKTNDSKVKAGVSHTDMGQVLRDLKALGWLKRGGTIDKQKIQRYKEFINK